MGEPDDRAHIHGDIGWNLVGPDGKVIARFDSGVDPLDDQVTDRIDAALAAK